ncbi:MAG: polysaccharide deacetylase family protein [Candidatus Verstraetearchaeota archaeon]|nr:polysaccharide deacetylase family protein [Candidatus Verstraetearchaeota archaeon]
MYYVALTFDDGTLHQYFCLKLLHRIGIKATLFQITGIQKMDEKLLLTSFPEKIMELADMGHEIASHSHTHKILTKNYGRNAHFQRSF